MIAYFAGFITASVVALLFMRRQENEFEDELMAQKVRVWDEAWSEGYRKAAINYQQKQKH